MIFVGKSIGKLDSKERLVVPVKFLRQLTKEDGQVMVVSRGLDKCLNLFTKDGWAQHIKPLQKMVKTADVTKARLLRQYMSTVELLHFDGSNRISFPLEIKSWASIDKEVVLVGMSNLIEVWSKQKYDLWQSELPDPRDLLMGIEGSNDGGERSRD